MAAAQLRWPYCVANHAAAGGLRGIPIHGTEAYTERAVLARRGAWEMAAAHWNTWVRAKSVGARPSFQQEVVVQTEAAAVTKRSGEVRCAVAAVHHSSDAAAIEICDGPSHHTTKALSVEVSDRPAMVVVAVAMPSCVVGVVPVLDAAVEVRREASPVHDDGSKAAAATDGCLCANHGSRPQEAEAAEGFAEKASLREEENEAARSGGWAQGQESAACSSVAAAFVQACGTCDTGTFSARQTSVPPNQWLHSARW